MVTRAKPYTIVVSYNFPTQTALEREIKRHLDALPLNERCEDLFLASVINSYHPGVIAAGQRSTGEFEYLDWAEQARRGLDSADRYRGGKLLTTRFLPLDDWRDVTAYPWRAAANGVSDIKRALREKIAPILAKPGPDCRCAVEGCTADWRDLEYQHAEPTFNQIANECIALMAPEEIESRFGYSKFIPGRDELAHCIPSDHPSILHLIDRHTMNTWEWLCAFHHRGVAVRESESCLRLF